MKRSAYAVLCVVTIAAVIVLIVATRGPTDARTALAHTTESLPGIEPDPFSSNLERVYASVRPDWRYRRRADGTIPHEIMVRRHAITLHYAGKADSLSTFLALHDAAVGETEVNTYETTGVRSAPVRRGIVLLTIGEAIEKHGIEPEARPGLIDRALAAIDHENEHLARAGAVLLAALDPDPETEPQAAAALSDALARGGPPLEFYVKARLGRLTPDEATPVP